MADVFISYKKEERERAYSIAIGLETLLVSTWLDAQLAPGQSFTDEIRRELDQCKAQLVCWSSASTRSEWVRGESEIGRKRGVLVPVFVEPCELLPPFNMLHTEDLSDWDGSLAHPSLQGVLRKLGALIGRPGLAELGRLMQSTDVVAWKAWLLRYPSDPGEMIAKKHVGENLGTDELQATTVPPAPVSPRVRSITELRAELEVADFRLRVFRDAAKRFRWKDTKEEARLELEVAALKEALTGLRYGSQKESPPSPERSKPIIPQIEAFLGKRTPVEQIGIAAIAALATFAFGFIALALLSVPIQMAQSASAQRSEETPTQAPATEVATPAPFDLALLGPSTNSTLFDGEFEAVGLDPTWAIQFSGEHATLQFRDGAAHDSYGGQREVRARGAQTTYRLGEPLAVVVIYQNCSLPNGVTTDFEVHVRSSVSTYIGCGAQRRSERWPPWNNYGSEYWRFERRPFED